MINSEILAAISANFGLLLSKEKPQKLSGGDISHAYRVASSCGKSYFVKLNQDSKLLEAEARNLALMSNASVFTAPIVGFFTFRSTGVLVLEHLALCDHGDEQALGRQLAKLHQSSSERYGLGYNNYIGATPQNNGWHDSWAQFWWNRRLAPQLWLAERTGFELRVDKVELKAISDALLFEHQPTASLLHGDLWAGNKGYLPDGRPVLFDPACYYGDRETDLAFTLVFGGFGHAFYQGYQAAWPLAAGWQARESLYNLYHLLNHLNLFGDSYLAAVRSTIKCLRQ